MVALKSVLITARFKRISLNSLWLLLARILSQGLMILFTILVARYMGEETLGQYAFIASIIFIGNVATTFGMDTLLIREVAAGRGREHGTELEISATLSAALAVQLILAAVIILLVWLGAGWLPNQTPDTLLPFRLASLTLLPLAFSTIYSAYLRGYERMDLYLLFNFISAFWMVVGVLVVLQTDGDLLGLSLLLLSAQAAGAVLAALLCRRFLPPLSFQEHWLKQRAIIPTLKTGFVLGALTALAVVYQRSGTLTLSLVEGDIATGWYSAAVRIIEAVKMVPYALFGAMFPIMARRAARRKPTNLPISQSPSLPVSNLQSPISGPPKARPFYDLSFFILLIFAGGAAMLLTLIAQPLIDLLYGPTYDPSVDALRILAWGLLPAVVTLRLSFDLVAAGRERVALIATAVTLVITLFITWELTRQYGLIGACAAVVGCETLQAIIFLLFTRRTYS